MNDWILCVFDGYSSSRRPYDNCTYGWVRMKAEAFPPGYIWHIEPKE